MKISEISNLDERALAHLRFAQAIWDVTRKDKRRPAKVFRDFHALCLDWGYDPWALLDIAVMLDPLTSGLPRYLLTIPSRDMERRHRAYARARKLVS